MNQSKPFVVLRNVFDVCMYGIASHCDFVNYEKKKRTKKSGDGLIMTTDPCKYNATNLEKRE